MKNRVDVNIALKAFNVITTRGEKTELGYQYENVNAASDFEGYTVVLSDKLSSLTIFFHNKYELEGADSLAMERLLKNIAVIAKQ